MTALEIILLVISLLLLALYVTSKLTKNQSLDEAIKEVKQDLKDTAENIYELVNKAKEVVFDESVQKTIKEFIMIVEEKNQIAKQNGEAYLVGDEKKLAVISRFSEWVSNITGSTEKAVEFVETNQYRIEAIINEYISFSNKMQGKETLSEAEKIIAEKLKKKDF
jgi:Na+-transporting methylmalonyl-CoA/oxaloacetate decarboxylase gamma subunit